jgi:tetratricopeptide (TPR) repeat protein
MENALRPCAHCAKPHAPQRCLCHMVSYCGPNCQKSHWVEHKKTCSVHETTNMEKIKMEHGRDSAEMIVTQYNLAGTLRNNEQYWKAEKILLKCLKSCEAQHFHEPSSNNNKKEMVALILLALGEVYVDRYELDKSRKLFNRALVLVEQAFGTGHWLLRILRRRLVTVKSIEKIDGSDIEFLETSLKYCQVDDDDDIISINYLLCASYCNLGELDLAMEAGLKSLAHARKISAMSSVGEALYCLSIVRSKQGEWDQALSNIEEALPILRATCGEKNVSVASALFQLGEIYAHQKRSDDALKLYKKALRYTRRCTGDKYRNLPAYTRKIIEVYDSQCRFAEALSMLEKDEGFFRSIMSEYDMITCQLRDLIQIQSSSVHS